MKERIENKWQEKSEDKILQLKFQKIFSNYITSLNSQYDKYRGFHKFHGKLKARFGANFLRNNKWWLE